MRGVIIKEGPFVFIRNVVVMEFIAAFFLYIASFLDNYEQHYQSLGLSKFIHYDNFLMLAFSLFQFGYILLLFLDWYFSYYEFRDREIIRKSGLMFRRRKSVSLANVTSVELYQSPLSRMIDHATIILEHGNDRITKLKNLRNYEDHLHIIKQSVQIASKLTKDNDVPYLLKQGEGLFLEFKETLRFDVRKGEVSREIERMVLKTIVGFLNTDGGTLLIGVNDEAQVTGLENDYKSLPKKNRDGLENHIGMLIKTTIGLPFAKYVRTKFESINGKDVCVINVMEGHKPAYLRNGDRHEDFFVRVGNSTQAFTMSEAEDYVKTHWG